MYIVQVASLIFMLILLLDGLSHVTKHVASSIGLISSLVKKKITICEEIGSQFEISMHNIKTRC